MAITLADFTKIWASTSPLTPYSFSESNYKEGWNFIGGTPPSRQMWDSIQNQNDEKLKYIVDNFLPTSGGTITGNLEVAGALTKGGNEVVTKKLETIPFTMTTNNGTASSLSAQKVGNIVVVNFAITLSSAVNVGGTISGTFSGLPQNVGSTPVNGVSYYSASALIISATSTSYSIRVIGAQLATGSGFGIYFMYATVN